MDTTPSVFISYSHDSDEHARWVEKLASDLAHHGVYVIFDKWDLRIGSDLRFFMEKGLNLSSLMLCICTETYVKKANNGVGGAGYETMIMTQELLQNVNANYIIPVVRENSTTEKVPFALGTKKYIDFSDDTQYIQRYTELLSRIFDEDIKHRPSLGTNPFSEHISQQISFNTRIQSVKYINPLMEGHVSFCFDNNGGVFDIGTGEYHFSTKWSRAGNDSIHACGYIGYKYDFIDYPALKEVTEFDFSSNSRTIRKGQLIIFENQYHHFAAVKLGEVYSAGHGHPYDIMEFDYKVIEL